MHQLIGRDAEMREDRSDHKRGDGDLDQRSKERISASAARTRRFPAGDSSRGQ